MAFWDRFKKESKEREELFRDKETKIDEVKVEPPEQKIKRTTHLKTKEEYKKEIEKQQINQYTQTLDKNVNYIGRYDPRIQEKYNTLLNNKVNDLGIKKTLIDQADIMLKERCTMTLILEGNDPSNKGIIEIIGILPEYEQQIREYFIGKKIHYQEWKKTLDGFKPYLNTMEKNIIAINSKLAIDEDLEVERIQITCTFK